MQVNDRKDKLIRFILAKKAANFSISLIICVCRFLKKAHPAFYFLQGL